MMSLAQRAMVAVLLSLSAGGTLGCELIAGVDRSLIGEAGGAGGQGGEGGEGGAGGQGGQGGQGGEGGSAAVCGDGVLGNGEACDDGNTAGGDGCDATCAIEAGYDCTGEPSACAPICGDGIIIGAETCDDMNTTAGDGCDAACAVEPGFMCNGAPSDCNEVCGDGLVVGAETCDDMNTASGDGCDGACAIEPGYACPGEPSVCDPVCGDGLVLGAEACDDMNTAAGDGCDATCTVENGYVCNGAPSACDTVCGDGILAGAEACDDGNLVDLDGCSSACVADVFDESEANNSVATADGPFTPGVLIHGAVAPGADVDYFAITLPATADLRVATFDGSGPSSCLNIDTVVTLLDTDGTTVLATDDDSGPNLCSRISGAASAHLPAGTYYVAVQSTGAVPIPAYTLVVTFDALCGDGVTEGAEECDSGAGCDATCDRVPTCGDGFVDGSEECDDGNQMTGDGCDDQCQYELLTESEPNDSSATADGPYTPNVLLGGAIMPIGDVDYFAIMLPATADLKIATFDASGPSSCVGIDTRLTLYATDGSTVLVNRDQGGVNNCATIDSNAAADAGARHLPAGTYFVKVQDSLDNNAIAGYTMLVTYNALCGDGVVQGAEECDGGAGCTATCDRIPVCGDGFIDGSETCDDGNTVAGDGCDATCQIELSTETEPNDTSATASGPFMPYALVQGSITGGGSDVDYIAFTLTATSDVRLELFDGNGPGSCDNIDTYLTLFGTDGSTFLASADDGGIDLCSLIDPTTHFGARHLPPGTYYALVEDFGYDTDIPAYRLAISLTAVCGNNVAEGYEECDGGAGCDANCDRIPSCGDGFVDGSEVCDDGNTMDGDGCSSTCALETTAEVEPNGTTVEADAAPVAIAGDALIAGAIGAVADHDVYRMTLAQASVVRLETFDGSGSDCAFITTTLTLRDAGGAVLYTNDNDGVSSCSALVLNLAAGTYYVEVNERGDDGTIAAYVLQAKVEADGGAEAEPNETSGTASAVSGTDVYVFGGHQSNTDSDYFAITVPAGKSIRAEIIEGGAETCESNEVDSALTLYNAAGLALGSDDDSGRGYCSRIDGTGYIPADTYASGLAAGTYYLQVEAAVFAQGAGDTTGQFDYRLVVTVR